MSITGQRLRERRKQLKINADDIAAQLNVSRSTIFRYENGFIEKVPVNVIEKLADILKTTPAYLMGQEDVPDKTLKSLIETASSNDRNHLSQIIEMYLKLTDKGKTKAYDYVLDLSEQSKYTKQPDSASSQNKQNELEIEVFEKREPFRS